VDRKSFSIVSENALLQVYGKKKRYLYRKCPIKPGKIPVFGIMKFRKTETGLVL